MSYDNDKIASCTPGSELNGVCRQIFLDHKSDLEDDSMVEFTEVKTCQFLDLFKTVYESISVNEKLS